MSDSLYFFFELTAFFVCLYTYKNLDSNFKRLLPYLAFVIVYEFVNVYGWLIWHDSNSWCNNLEGIIEVIVYGSFIASFDDRKSYKRKVYLAISGVILISMIDIVFIHGFWKLATIAGLLQYALLITLVCIYYSNLMDNAKEELDLLKHPPFIAATAIMFYALAEFFFYAAYYYMAYRNNYKFYLLGNVISDISLFILFSLLSYSFLCFSKTSK